MSDQVTMPDSYEEADRVMLTWFGTEEIEELIADSERFIPMARAELARRQGPLRP